MIFEYNEQAVFTESIDVVDIGNVALRASNDKGAEYYIVLKTGFGKTNILKFGPIMADTNILLDGFALSFNKVDYKESVLNKTINQFINDYKKEITKVDELTEYDAFKSLPEFVSSFMEVE